MPSWTELWGTGPARLTRLRGNEAMTGGTGRTGGTGGTGGTGRTGRTGGAVPPVRVLSCRPRAARPGRCRGSGGG
ncbi:hypothetical protein B8W73_08480 [Arthrobacter agilis]|nr:hypothetical protein B8W73_08480 [Arthrobacter agilis]